MSKLKEMFESAINDPDLENNPMFKDCEKFRDAMDELTARIAEPCIEYANSHGDEDDGWAHTIMISMARATSKILYILQYTAAEEGKDVYEFYYDELLPLCKEIVYPECDEMVKRMKRKYEEKERSGVSFDIRKEIILAIADPDMSIAEIIERFFKKDLTDEQRQMVSDRIEKMRVEHAVRLRRLHEHTDEHGNYKA